MRVAALAFVLGSLLVPAPAAAVTPREAKDIALKTLKVKKAPAAAALFGLPKALAKGTWVNAAGTDGSVKAGPVRLAGVRLKRPAYLFWLDRQYQGALPHPGTLLLIDASSGKRVARRELLWPLLVNGKRTAFDPARSGYRSSKYRLFLRAHTLRTPARLGRVQAAQASVLPPNYFARDCVIMIGDRANPTFAGNFKAMKKWADGVNLTSSFAVDKNDLASDVQTFVAAGCKDVFVYLTGHGQPPPGWTDAAGFKHDGSARPTISLGQKFVFDKKGGTKLEEQTITDADLRAIFKGFATTEFKLVVDGCFSGRFASLDAETNVVRFVASSSATQTSQGFLSDAKVEKDGKLVPWSEVADNRFMATEFTNGLAHGLDIWSKSATETASHPGLPGGLGAAVTLGKEFDGAQWIPPGEPGHTDPLVLDNPPMQAPAPGPSDPGPGPGPSGPTPTYRCTGDEILLFDNWNGFTVSGGGTAPTFSTGGASYCVTSIATYHYNDAAGGPPGTISLKSGSTTVGSWPAVGQNMNYDWVATPPADPPVVINGTYTCEDSDHATWSRNLDSGDKGFCRVSVRVAEKTS